MIVAPPSGLRVDRLERKPREVDIDLPVGQPARRLEQLRRAAACRSAGCGPARAADSSPRGSGERPSTASGGCGSSTPRANGPMSKNATWISSFRLGDAHPAERREELGQRGDAGVRGGRVEAAPDRERPGVENRADPDVGREERPIPPRAIRRERARKTQAEHERAEGDAREDRVEDEEPVERVAGPGERRPEHGAERGRPVEDDVRGDPDRGEEPEHPKRSPAGEDLRQEREAQREKRQDQKRMRPAPMVPQVLDPIRDHQEIEVRERPRPSRRGRAPPRRSAARRASAPGSSPRTSARSCPCASG